MSRHPLQRGSNSLVQASSQDLGSFRSLVLHRCIFTNILVLAQQVYSFLRPLTSLIIPPILAFLRVSAYFGHSRSKGQALPVYSGEGLVCRGEPSRLYRPSVYRQIATCLEGRTTSCDTVIEWDSSPAIYFLALRLF